MTENTDVVVLTEAMAFHEARLLMERAQKETFSRFAHDMDPHDAYRLGKLNEALDVAANAVFNALNVAASHCHCQEAKAAINAWYQTADAAADVEVIA